MVKYRDPWFMKEKVSKHGTPIERIVYQAKQVVRKRKKKKKKR